MQVCLGVWGFVVRQFFVVVGELCRRPLIKKTKLAKYIYHISYHSKLSTDSFSFIHQAWLQNHGLIPRFSSKKRHHIVFWLQNKYYVSYLQFFFLKSEHLDKYRLSWNRFNQKFCLCSEHLEGMWWPFSLPLFFIAFMSICCILSPHHNQHRSVCQKFQLNVLLCHIKPYKTPDVLVFLHSLPSSH